MNSKLKQNLLQIVFQFMLDSTDIFESIIDVATNHSKRSPGMNESIQRKELHQRGLAL